MATIKLAFKPKATTKKLLSNLKDRARDVIVKRYGLDNEESQTLQSIGDMYGITRERVRQIENFAIKAIRTSDSFGEAREIFDELRIAIDDLGGVVHEDHLLEKLAKDKITQNHIQLYLVLGDEFEHMKEDDDFKSRWSVDNTTSQKVHKILDAVQALLSDDKLREESEVVNEFIAQAEKLGLPEHRRRDDVAKRLLWMSKRIGRNALGHWGMATSSNVKTRGVRDLAYLIMRSHGSPMHFREVAKAITETFDRPTHTATCHNELIKDDRFVLIGRGMYALKEWGYRSGTARQVIAEIIKDEGKPMSREEIVKRVETERYLKRNTILVNLQNPKFFKKDENGLYTIK